MHNLRYIWNPELDKATRISLKNRRCSLNEVDGIYHVLLVLQLDQDRGLTLSIRFH